MISLILWCVDQAKEKQAVMNTLIAPEPLTKGIKIARDMRKTWINPALPVLYPVYGDH
jgi:hypothetical protein